MLHGIDIIINADPRMALIRFLLEQHAILLEKSDMVRIVAPFSHLLN